MHWEARFRCLAATQDGVIGIDQVPALGCDNRHWHRAKTNTRWTALSRRVLRLEGSTASPAQRVRAAILDAGGGAILHGASTLGWAGLRGYDLSTLHVTRRRGSESRPARLATVHRLRDLTPGEICIVRDIPTVTVLRAIWSEASRYSNERFHEWGLDRIGRLLDEANRMQLVTWAGLHRSVELLERSGRAGTRLMRELAAARQPGTAVTESRNEDQFESILAARGVEPFRRQVRVGGQALIGRADFADPDLPLVVEVNSDAFHSLPSDQAADEARYLALAAAGFTVAVIWEVDIWSRPTTVVATTVEARRRARLGERVVIHSHGCPWPADDQRVVIRSFTPPTRG